MTPTLIDIGPQQTLVHGAGASLVLALGSAAIAERLFRHDPPTPYELESAIDAVEGEVMRAGSKPTAGNPVLTTGGAALCEVAGMADAQGMLTLDAVEQLFQCVASESLGNPMARRGLPAGNQFVATLLILREFMHHRGFASVRFSGLGS